MKKNLLITLAAVGMLSLTSCEDFLDSKNYTQANTGNYPAAAATSIKNWLRSTE